MFTISLQNDFAAYFAVTSLALIVSAVLYIWFVYVPYSKFPAFRLEHRILYWIFKRVPLNYAMTQFGIEQSKRYESEGVFAVWIGVPALAVYGGEIIKKIVSEHAGNVKPRCYKLFDFAIDKSLLTSNGEMYKKQLKMVAPAFHVPSVKLYTDIMNRHSEEVVEVLSDLDGQPTDDIGNIVGIFAMRTILESNLGEREVNAEECLYVMEALKKIGVFVADRQWSPWLYFDFSLKLFPSARKVQKLTTSLLEEFLKPRLEKIKESILSRRPDDSDPESNPGRRHKPFGQTFVEQHLQDPTITMDEVNRQVALIAVAAFDSVKHALGFAVYLLGLHQDVQDRAFQEVLSETGGHVTFEDQQRLTYLECVIKETLRLYPVAPLLGRSLTKDLQVGKYKLPRNSTVGLFLYRLHRDPEIYPDPEKFVPERFLDKDSRIKPWNYIPFAEGLRPCVGKNYAMVVMKILLSHLLRNFRIVTLDRMEETDLTWSIILIFRKKPRIQFLPRA